MPATSEVFVDPSGRRWRRIQLWLLGTLVLSAALVGVSWGPVRAAPELSGAPPPQPRVDLGNADASPFIGTGPLARLVRLERRGAAVVGVDPLTGADVHTLTAADLDAVGNHPFAIYRYGYDQGVHRTISLTFDDGPDPVWTPQILDLLSRNHVPATFFVIGSQTVRYSKLVEREKREGHAIGNHTMTHPELSMATIKQELVTTDRVLSATAGVRTGLARLPYDGYGPSGKDTEGGMLLEAQRLGYVVSVEDFDSGDWRFGNPAAQRRSSIPLPPRSMDNVTVLLHDGGGNRAATLAYLKRLIPWARAHGYTFHSLPQVSHAVAARWTSRAPSLWDRETLWAFQVRWLLPNTLLRLLFWIAMVSVVVGGMTNVALAAGRDIRRRRRSTTAVRQRPGPSASAVVAAYNEEAVIGRCLAALCGSRCGELTEIIVVDDGSTDDTADIVRSWQERDRRVRLISRPNGGKAGALNRGFVEAGGEIVITLDADTLLTPGTAGHLLRRFVDDDDGRLGAVAGTVKVGNLGNVLTRWQALEYVMQIGVDRSAQDALHAIMVVPGACAAWRRDAVLRVGGYSSQTFAEDCDLALQLQHAGYRVVQCDDAESYTEAPVTFRDLRRQRFRWMLGNVQALWKHRSMMLNPRYGWLGMFTLPAAAVSILLPLVFLPFVYAMAVLTIQGQRGWMLLLYAAVIMAVQFVQAAAGVLLSREDPRHLWMVPLYRLIGEPLRAYLLYKTALTAMRGTRSSWNKVSRSGTVRVRETPQAEVRA